MQVQIFTDTTLVLSIFLAQMVVSNSLYPLSNIVGSQDQQSMKNLIRHQTDVFGWKRIKESFWHGDCTCEQICKKGRLFVFGLSFFVTNL